VRPSDILGGLYEETGLLEGSSAAWPLSVEDADWGRVHEFAAAVGPEIVERCYGWRGGRPRPPAPGERVWLFRRDGEPVAWSAARPDPTTPIAWLALGVWPRWQRQGWAGHVRAWTAARALMEWPVEWLAVEVLVSNRDHLRRWLEHPPEGWQVAGMVSVPPPGSAIFARPR
jgi:GNAT superfamily N-acetyltransferase